MIGLDTNVIIRFLTNDDPQQSAAAMQQLKDIQAHGRKARVSKIVLLETVWVLSSAYGFDDQRIIEAIDTFSQLAVISCEDADLITRLKALYNDQGPNLSDQLILADYLFQGCDRVVTFDTRAQRLDGFDPVG